MFLLVDAPRFSTAAPGLLNNDGEITISLPILNIGTAVAANLRVTKITLGSAVRRSPAAFPLFIGDLGLTNPASVAARFDVTGLSVGGRYLLTVQGSYESNNATFGFAVNRYIVVPPPSPPPVVFLKAHVDVAVGAGLWTYTIFNDEPVNSPQFIATFSLEVVAPFTVTGIPQGWLMETDNVSYVLWAAADEQLPYPHHIAPGGSLGGFQIQSSSSGSESTPYVLTSWNHESDEAGLVFPDLVLSPARTQ